MPVGLDPFVLARWIRRAALLVFAAGVVWFWWNFGVLRVPPGMDTMLDTHPPGTVCVIAKRPRHVPSGSVVFLDLEQGGTVLTRVIGRTADGRLRIHHDTRASRWVELEREDGYTEAAVRGLVLTQFAAD